MKNHLASAVTLCLLLTCLLAQQVSATPLDAEEITSGSLYYRNSQTAAPLLDTQVSMYVTGMLVRTTVTQRFKNTSDQWQEGVYLFPLPDDASVDELKMKIGERVITGVIRSRQRAQQQYDAAKREGKQASLIEQQRANLFTSYVANIPPGDSVDITVAFQSAVRYDDGQFSLQFPLTVTPRYQPGSRLAKQVNLNESLNPTSPGWAIPTTITTPMVAADHGPTTTITVDIDAGVPLQSVVSTTHAITTSQTGELWQVTLADEHIPMDRDFRLNWQPPVGQSPLAAVFRENTKNAEKPEAFASVMLLPPQQLFDTLHATREVIFVIDTSGSMQGNSIIQARKAVAFAINRLTPQDTFNVIEFDDNAHRLYTTAMAATDVNRLRAVDWVNKLTADGGTEIGSAMRLALGQNNTTNNGIRQVVFITDGSVGNEDQIFKYIKSNLGNSRLFTIGIGSAPNTWFMRKAAEFGRGSYTSISKVREIKNSMMQLLHKLERPVVTDVSIEFEGVAQPEFYPTVLPDLYAGEPIVIDARWQHEITNGSVKVHGTHNGQEFSRELTLNTQQQSDSQLSKRFAKRKIETLEDRLLFNANTVEIEHQITDVALNYGLVTKYTSLVAVQEKVVRDPQSSDLHTVAVPSAMPQGNTMAFPQGSLGLTLRWALAAVFSILAVLFGLATLQQVRNHSQPSL